MVYGLFEYLPHVVAAVLIIVFGSFAARFLARAVLISAVNTQIRSALAVGPGSKYEISRAWQRSHEQAPEPEDTIHHL
jgi:hypothetical protein